MKELNLDIASEYLVMASELIEMKSSMLLPKNDIVEDEYEEDPKERLIKRLIEYKRYKELVPDFKELEQLRKEEFTKEPDSLDEFKKETEDVILEDLKLEDLINAFSEFLKRKELEKPLNTKITKKEYSVKKRNKEIKKILEEKKKISFDELFDVMTKDYVVVTFLSILDLARKQSLVIKQENNFNKIYLKIKESD